ncbi:MAG: sugar ABC transporter permease [Bacillota bacterium]|nr:sugar ABC transporter permease [Bacillota bacterium]
MNTLKREKNTIRILFLLPIFVLFIVFIVYSIYFCFRASLYDWNGVGPLAADKFSGLRNWKNLVNDGEFWSAAKNNIKMIFISILGQLPIGLLMALFIDHYGKRAKFFKIVWFLPYLMSSSTIGLLFSYLVNNYTGPIAGMLKTFFGIKMPSLLGNPQYAFSVVAAAVIWQYVSFYMIYYLAGLSTIPVDLYEAAVIDGATRIQYTFRCAIPMIAPTIRNAIVLQLIGSLKYFDLVYVMTEGAQKTELMATYMYKMTFQSTRMGYGSAIAAVMFLIITALALITVKLLERRGED